MSPSKTEVEAKRERRLNEAFGLEGEDEDLRWKYFLREGMFPAYRLDVSPIERCPNFTLIVLTQQNGLHQWQIEVAGEGITPKIDHPDMPIEDVGMDFECCVEAALEGREVLEAILGAVLKQFGSTSRPIGRHSTRCKCRPAPHRSC